MPCSFHSLGAAKYSLLIFYHSLHPPRLPKTLLVLDAFPNTLPSSSRFSQYKLLIKFLLCSASFFICISSSSETRKASCFFDSLMLPQFLMADVQVMFVECMSKSIFLCLSENFILFVIYCNQTPFGTESRHPFLCLKWFDDYHLIAHGQF